MSSCLQCFLATIIIKHLDLVKFDTWNKPRQILGRHFTRTAYLAHYIARLALFDAYLKNIVTHLTLFDIYLSNIIEFFLSITMFLRLKAMILNNIHISKTFMLHSWLAYLCTWYFILHVWLKRFMNFPTNSLGFLVNQSSISPLLLFYF